MEEVNADVLIVETNESHKTPFTIEIPAGVYTLKASFENKSAEVKADVKAGEKTKVDITLKETPPPVIRKGLPSSSGIMKADIIPEQVGEYEETILPSLLNKATYKPGEDIDIVGELKFKIDDTPLSNRTITILENNALIGTTTTNADGYFIFTHLAPIVEEPAEYLYEAKFGGD